MRISADHIDFVRIEGLPPGSVFCSPETADVLRARVLGEHLEVDVADVRGARPWISDVRVALVRLVSALRGE